jgi:hypothetical protein
VSDEIETTVEEEEGILNVTVSMPRDHGSLDGNGTISAPITVADIDVRAEEDTVEALANALLTWYTEQQPTGPPGEKPIHQQMNEVYDR